jgi:hypothetical protein
MVNVKRFVFLFLLLVSTWNVWAAEPTQQPTGFNVSSRTNNSITVSWTNVGDVNRTGYLLMINTTGTFTNPTDGAAQTDDTDLSDNAGVINLGPAISTYNWTSANAATRYYFKIFPYGSSSDYFLTMAPTTDGYTLANEPTQASNIVFSSLGTVSYAIEWTDGGAGFRRLVVGNATGPVDYTLPADGTVESTPANPDITNVGSLLPTGTGNHLLYDGNGSGPITISGLTANTVYHFRVFEYAGAPNSINYNGNTATGNPSSRTTLQTEPSTQSTGSLSFSSIGTNTITVTNGIAGDGDSRLLVVHASTAVSANPADGISYTANGDIGLAPNLGSSNFVVGSGTGPWVVSGLSANTVYHFKVFEFNGSSGAENYLTSGTPLTGNRSTLAAEPTAQPTTLTFTSLLENGQGYTIGWTAATGSPDGYIALRRSGSSPADVPVDGTTYTAGNTIGSSTVAFVGAGTSSALTGLTDETEYYFDVFSYNGSGNTINYYLTSPLEGNRFTLAVAPSDRTNAFAAANSAGTANINLTFGSITASSITNGDGYIILRSKTGNPTTTGVNDGTAPGSLSLPGGTSLVTIINSTATNAYADTGLEPNTQYYYTIITYNADGGPNPQTYNYYTSAVRSANATTSCVAPVTQTSAITFGTKTASTVVVNWTRGSGDKVIVLARQANAAAAFTLTDGTAYTADPAFGSGTTVGVSGNDYFVVYIGTGTTQTVTDLNGNTDYYFSALEFNDAGGGSFPQCYNNTSPAGNTTTTNAADNNSTLTLGTGVATISSLADTPGERVASFTFTVTDLGTDGTSTRISQMVFTPGTGNDVTDWTQALSAANVILEDDDGNTSTDHGTPVIAAGSITIPSILTGSSSGGELGYIADNTNKVYILKLHLNTNLGTSKSTIDGQNFVFEILAANCAIVSGKTGIAPGQNTNSGSTNNSVTVLATEIRNLVAPSTSANAAVPLASQPTFEATDINGNRDLDFTSAITSVNTNNPDNLSPVFTAFNFGNVSQGVATFTDLRFNNTGSSTMSITSGGFTSPNSALITVTASTAVAQLTNGVAAPPLASNATNQAVIGFSLQTTGSALNFTGIKVQTSNDPDGKVLNARVFGSSDNTFDGGDLALAGSSYTTPLNEISITGFTAPISGTITYYFVVVNVEPFFQSASPTIQFTITPNTTNVTVSGGSGITGSAFSSTNYGLLDNIAPTVVSVTALVNPVYEGGLTQNVRVIFSESMNTATSPTITFGTSTNFAPSGVAGSWSQTNFPNDTWTKAYIHNGTQETVAAEVANVAATSGATDWNSQANTNAAVSPSFNLDTRKPIAAVTVTPSSVTTVTPAISIKVVYDESMDTGTNPTITLAPANANFSAGAGVWSTTTFTNDTYTIVYTHNLTPQTIASTTATATLGKDVAGNTQPSAISAGFFIDTQRPTAAITYDDVNGYVRAGQTLRITANFSEAVADAPVMQLSLSGGNTLALTDMVKTTSTQYYYDYVIPGGNGTVTVAMGTGRDIAGNLITAAPSSGATYIVDSINPTLSTLVPADGSFNIELDKDLTITLTDANVDILKGTGLIEIYTAGSVLVESFDVATSPRITISPSNRLVINPTANLPASTNYYVLIAPSAITDLAGNPFAGFTLITEWNFRTWGPPVINSVAPLVGSAVCIGSEVVITGDFLTGTTQVKLGGAGGLNAFSFSVISDTEVRAVAPLNAPGGQIYLRKDGSGTTNPDVNVTSAGTIVTGPSIAVLAVGSINNSTVCTTGTITTSTIKFTVTGGTGPFSATYSAKPGALPAVNNLVSSYTSGTDITIDPTNSVNNLYQPVSVVDANNCPVPTGAPIGNQLSGSYNVLENTRPVVDAGGPVLPPFSYCIANGLPVTLNGATLGIAPSMSGAGGQSWITNGSGTFNNSTLLQPIYTISIFDILNNNLQLTITTTSNPAACDPVSDDLVFTFVSNSTADPNGPLPGVTQVQCWNGALNPTAQLNGTIGGGATGYSWASVTGLVGQFSSTTISNPTYTFNATETAQQYADITLTPTGGTCGGPGSPSPLRITLNPLPVNAFVGTPATLVCVGQTYTYKLSSNPGNTYAWTVPSSNGTMYEDNGNQINVTWGTVAVPGTPENYNISVIETRASDGCQSQPINLPVTLNQEPIPSFTSPSSAVFGNNTPNVLLQGSGPTVSGVTSFSGAGVFIATNGNWYFSPENAGINANIPVTYTYTNNLTTCSNSTTRNFTVFDGANSIIQADDSPFNEFCNDADPVTIKLDPAIHPLLTTATVVEPVVVVDPNYSYQFTYYYDYTFSGFTSLYGIMSNTPGVAPKNVDGTAVFDPEQVPPGVNSVRVEYLRSGDVSYSYVINYYGFTYGPYGPYPYFTLLNESFGGQDVIIDPIPVLQPLGLTDRIFCSNDSKVDLLTGNPGAPSVDFSFFVDPVVDANYPGIVALNAGTNRYELDPQAYSSAFFDGENIEIKYSYEDNKGCNDTTSLGNKSIEVFIAQQPPAPTIDYPSTDLCVVNGVINPVKITNRVTNLTGPATVGWYDNPGLAGSSLSSDTTFTAPISTASNATFSFYTVQDINLCRSPITQLNYEVLNVPQYTWDKFWIDGTPTSFDVNLGSVNANSLVWAIDRSDGSNLSLQTQTGPLTGAVSYPFTFTTPDAYKVDLTINSVSGCTSSLELPAIIVEKKVVTDLQPYSGTFESANGDGWVPFGRNSSWANGLTSGKDITTTSKAWVTSLTSNYNVDEASYLYSPAFDLTTLQRPMIAFDSWIITDGADGAVLQYSVDDVSIGNPAKVWKNVGAVGTGTGWYNKVLINSNPSGLSNNIGWSNLPPQDTLDWRASKNVLDGTVGDLLTASGTPGHSNTAVFRLAFASTDRSNPHDGMAIDNVYIGNRTRTILLENFFNKGNLLSGNPEKTESDFVRNANNQTVGTQLVTINYHVGFPQPDPLNQDEPAEPGARALYYNVSTTPTARLDGIDYATATQPYLSSWGSGAYSTQSLQLAQANLTINAAPNPDGTIGVSVDVEALVDLPANAILHVAVVEDSIPFSALSAAKQALITTGETDFQFVLKAMLPSASGTRLGTPLAIGNSRTFSSLVWTPQAAKLYTPANDLHVVAFLQNETTREVYQAEIVKFISDPPVVTGFEPEFYQNIAFFPNPADHELTVQLPEPAKAAVPLRMFDPLGRQVVDIRFEVGEQTRVIQTSDMASGLYIIQVEPGGVAVRKKQMIKH